jgi:hypothetical protein
MSSHQSVGAGVIIFLGSHPSSEPTHSTGVIPSVKFTRFSWFRPAPRRDFPPLRADRVRETRTRGFDGFPTLPAKTPSLPTRPHSHHAPPDPIDLRSPPVRSCVRMLMVGQAYLPAPPNGYTTTCPVTIDPRIDQVIMTRRPRGSIRIDHPAFRIEGQEG